MEDIKEPLSYEKVLSNLVLLSGVFTYEVIKEENKGSILLKNKEEVFYRVYYDSTGLPGDYYRYGNKELAFGAAVNMLMLFGLIGMGKIK